RADLVDDRSLPRRRVGGRTEEPVDVDARMRRDAEAEAAYVRVRDHDLRPAGAVERRGRHAVHAEERPLVDTHGGPALAHRVGGLEEGPHLAARRLRVERREDVEAAVTVEVE